MRLAIKRRRGAGSLVQLHLKWVMAIFEGSEQIAQIGVFHWNARIIGDQILFRNIGDVVRLIIFRQKMVERLIS